MLQRDQLIAFRRRERTFVAPALVVAALTSMIWLSWPLPTVWLAAGLGFMALNAAFLEKRFLTQSRFWSSEAVMALMTLINASAFMALPLALIMRGEQMATLAGVCIAGSLTLRGAYEYTFSKLIGGASLFVLFFVAAIGAIWRPMPVPPIEVVAVLLNVTLLFINVFSTAASRRRAEEGMAAALALAERSRIEAQAASEAKSAFVATLSHEIRTPLNGVVGMAQTMDTGGMTQRQMEQLGVIQRSGAALNAILNDVLDLSKIEAGKLEPVYGPFSVKDIALSVIDVFLPIAKQRGLAFDFQISSEADNVFLSDGVRIRQIITNLISNAVKFTERGSVHLSLDYRDGRLEILIADTGVGISEEGLEKLFSRFTQVDDSRTGRYGGTGLGLSITRALCDLLDGKIDVESKRGAGTRFRVSIPMTLSQVPGLPGSEDQEIDDWTPKSDLRILAAEDNSVNQIVLKTMLEQLGVVPTIVANGQQALEAYSASAWDVVLMDVQMPIMDGLTATRMIRELEAQSSRGRTPILALTADAMAHQVDDYLKTGMDGCISKPINAREMFSALGSALSGERAA